jgi:hypothetical protein
MVGLFVDCNLQKALCWGKGTAHAYNHHFIWLNTSLMDDCAITTSGRARHFHMLVPMTGFQNTVRSTENI